jgi:hypothetical protein
LKAIAQVPHEHGYWPNQRGPVWGVEPFRVFAAGGPMIIEWAAAISLGPGEVIANP